MTATGHQVINWISILTLSWFSPLDFNLHYKFVTEVLFLA
jgi:hypothetical protein